MQSIILSMLMIILSIFIVAELSRTSSAEPNLLIATKAGIVADNVLLYQDNVVAHILANYDALHVAMLVDTKPSNDRKIHDFRVIEKSAMIKLDYKEALDGSQKILSTQKAMTLFLNYHSAIFNYTEIAPSENNPVPTLYLITSFDAYWDTKKFGHYKEVKFPEIMGQLGQKVSKRLYQGNNTYWVVPWVFSQDKCEITELYSQIPDGKNGEQLGKVRQLFKFFCTQLKEITSLQYNTLKYVYIQPIFMPADI